MISLRSGWNAEGWRHECKRALIGYLLDGGAIAARPGLVEVTGGMALSGGCPPGAGCGSHLACPAGYRGVKCLMRGLPSSK